MPIPKKPLTPEEALLKMADLCARSEQCPFDIDRKLRSKGLTASQSLEVIEELISRRFIDEHRFASGFARDKVRFSGWGRMKIRAGLAAKRIPSAVVAEALESIPEEDYTEALRRVARSKASSLDLAVYEERVKLVRHLLSRGFESPLAVAETSRLAKEAQAAEES